MFSKFEKIQCPYGQLSIKYERSFKRCLRTTIPGFCSLQTESQDDHVLTALPLNTFIRSPKQLRKDSLPLTFLRCSDSVTEQEQYLYSVISETCFQTSSGSVALNPNPKQNSRKQKAPAFQEITLPDGKDTSCPWRILAFRSLVF